MLKKGTPASPATARASSVLPVPGGPTISTPLGMRAPRRMNFSGSLRKLHDLGQFLLGFLRAGHVREGHLRPLHVAGNARATATEADRLVLAAAHRTHHAPQQPDDDDGRHDGDEQLEDQAAGVVALLLGVADGLQLRVTDAVGAQIFKEVRLAFLVVKGGEAAKELDVDVLAAAHDELLDVAALDLGGQFIERDAVCCSGSCSGCPWSARTG